MKKQKAFTLAEVLITLVIIGIIAAMTIPSLLNNTNKQEYRTGLKKSVSVLNQAITMNYALDGKTVADYSSATDLITNMLQKRLNIINVSGTTFYTADGMKFTLGDKGTCASDGSTKCYDVTVDINGEKKPNEAATGSGTTLKVTDRYKLEMYAQRVTTSDGPTKEVLYDSGLSN